MLVVDKDLGNCLMFLELNSTPFTLQIGVNYRLYLFLNRFTTMPSGVILNFPSCSSTQKPCLSMSRWNRAVSLDRPTLLEISSSVSGPLSNISSILVRVRLLRAIASFLWYSTFDSIEFLNFCQLGGPSLTKSPCTIKIWIVVFSL